jgi:hypothetical protein
MASESPPQNPLVGESINNWSHPLVHSLDSARLGSMFFSAVIYTIHEPSLLSSLSTSSSQSESLRLSFLAGDIQQLLPLLLPCTQNSRRCIVVIHSESGCRRQKNYLSSLIERSIHERRRGFWIARIGREQRSLLLMIWRSKRFRGAPPIACCDCPSRGLSS